MNTVTWEVKYDSPPKAMRHCTKCGAKTVHDSSGLFRVNAQKKQLDVWLVYRCAHCGGTWKLTILSRVSPESVGRELLERFTINDAALACAYAGDEDLLTRNGATSGPPSYAVAGEKVNPMAPSRVALICDCASKLRVGKVVREKLGLSNRAFGALVAQGVIRMENGADIEKARLGRGAVVLIGCGAPE